MTPTTGWTIGGSAVGSVTAPLQTTTQQASLTSDYIPMYSASLAGTYAVNLANMLGISSQVVSTTDPQTLTQKTITAPAISAPVLSGSATGTYTLAGTPTITAPTITNPTITGGSLAMDTITGHAVSNTGSIFGISVALGVITQANSIAAGTIVQNGVAASQLATNAVLLGYSQLTNAIGSFSTSSTSYVQVTNLTVTVTIPAGGRTIKVSCAARSLLNTGVSYSEISIWDGIVGSGTMIADCSMESAIANAEVPIYFFALVTPAAGSKTYNVGLKAIANTATLTVSVSGPATILVEAI